MNPDCSECAWLKKAVPAEHITHIKHGRHAVACPNLVEECDHR